jgi:hypothetical protein
MATVFPLAPMTRDLRILTGVLLVLPPALFAAALLAPPGPQESLRVAAGLSAAIYLSVWLGWRPTRFEIDGEALRIVWPMRSRTIPRRDVTAVRLLPACELGREYGRGVRIGVGGLWGGFGWLRTRTATFSMWISRTDRLVLVELRAARPLLLTPENPERFVAMLA